MRVQVSPSVFFNIEEMKNLPFNLEDLIVIRTIVKYGSFKKAGIQLGVSQPTISFHIKNLEKKIGKLIFIRKIPLSLTESGIILYRYSEKILFLCEEACITLNKIKFIEKEIIIGASQTVGTYLMPQVLKLLKKKYPNVNLKLEIYSSKKICWLIANGQIDFAIIGGKIPNELKEILEIIPYAEDELALIVSKTHHLINEENFKNNEENIRKEDLYRMKFINLNKNSTLQKIINEILEKNNIDLKRLSIIMELNTIEGIKNAVQSGLGFSFISVLALIKELESKSLVKLKIKDINIKRVLNIVVHSSKYNDKSFQVFLNEILNMKL